MKLGRKLGKQLLSGILTISMVLSSAITSYAYTEDSKILPAVSTPSSECVLIGIKGDYITQAKEALKRINEIRWEACVQGVPKPGNPSVKLTENDYVEIKWSADLEKVARIRAAEASLVISHTRPNGKSGSTLGVTGVSYSEVLAWNWSSSMLDGIEQWYEEKGDWVTQNSNKVTGHYTIMINPSNTYVGIGCMLTSDGLYPNTTCGRFGSSSSALDETMGEKITDCIQLIEIKKSALTDVTLNKVSNNSVSNLKIGDTVSYELIVETSLEDDMATALLMDNVKWTSSDTKIATVDTYGKVTGVGAGTVSITASSDSGLAASVSLTFTCSHDERGYRGAQEPTCTTDGYTGDEYCKVCGEKITSGSSIKATGHQWDSGKVTEKATATKDGKILYTCMVCQTTKIQTIPATGNNADKEETPPSVSKVKSLKAKAGSKKLTVTWEKLSGAAGYELQVSTKSSFKGAKTVKIGKSKKQYVVKKLKAKTKYYVRIRAYKTFKDAKGKTQKAYGKWVKINKKTK